MRKFPKFDISLTGSSVEDSYLVVYSFAVVLLVTIKIFRTKIYLRVSRGEIAIWQYCSTDTVRPFLKIRSLYRVTNMI